MTVKTIVSRTDDRTYYDLLEAHHPLVLHVLAVSPHHQRKGLGALLICDGLALADKYNARTYIEASPVGLQLYLRHGWELVDDILMDMTPFGGTGIASEKILMRAPAGV